MSLSGEGVEAGLFMMLERMQTGRLKVFRHLTDWLEEFRLYHRDAGKVVKLRDDLISATRYALMCLRFAKPAGATSFTRKLRIRCWGLCDRDETVRRHQSNVASKPCNHLIP